MGDWLAILFWGIFDLLLLALSVYLLTGRGGMLIAGYNTSSDEEKKKYDEKKLCRSMGVTMLIITLGMGALTTVTYFVEIEKLWTEAVLENAAYLFCGLVLAVVAAEIIYGNTRCKRKELEDD